MQLGALRRERIWDFDGREKQHADLRIRRQIDGRAVRRGGGEQLRRLRPGRAGTDADELPGVEVVIRGRVAAREWIGRE